MALVNTSSARIWPWSGESSVGFKDDDGADSLPLFLVAVQDGRGQRSKTKRVPFVLSGSAAAEALLPPPLS